MTFGEARQHAVNYVAAVGNAQPERTDRVERAKRVLGAYKFSIIESKMAKAANETHFGKESNMSNKSRKAKIAAGRKAAEEKKDTKAPVAETKAEKAQEKDDKTLKISRKDAVSMLRAIGFKTPEHCDNETTARRLGKLQRYMESYEGTLDGDTQELVDKIIKAGSDGISVMVMGDEPKKAHKEGDRNDKATKPADKGKKKASEAGKKSGKKDGIRRKGGGELSVILARLEKGPATKEQLVKAVTDSAEGKDESVVARNMGWYLSGGCEKRRGIKLVKSDDGKWSVAKGK